jgi:hypothetical protein
MCNDVFGISEAQVERSPKTAIATQVAIEAARIAGLGEVVSRLELIADRLHVAVESKTKRD